MVRKSSGVTKFKHRALALVGRYIRAFARAADRKRVDRSRSSHAVTRDFTLQQTQHQVLVQSLDGSLLVQYYMSCDPSLSTCKRNWYCLVSACCLVLTYAHTYYGHLM
jgi:hypothetical protein